MEEGANIKKYIIIFKICREVLKYFQSSKEMGGDFNPQMVLPRSAPSWVEQQKAIDTYYIGHFLFALKYRAIEQTGIHGEISSLKGLLKM